MMIVENNTPYVVRRIDVCFDLSAATVMFMDELSCLCMFFAPLDLSANLNRHLLGTSCHLVCDSYKKLSAALR